MIVGTRNKQPRSLRYFLKKMDYNVIKDIRKRLKFPMTSMNKFAPINFRDIYKTLEENRAHTHAVCVCVCV